MDERQPAAESPSGRAGQVFVPFVAALQFLTLVPPVVVRLFTADEMGRAGGYFPLVGALLGMLLAALDWTLLRVFPVEVSSALVLAAGVGVTGALHLDGFLDASTLLSFENTLQLLHSEGRGDVVLDFGRVLYANSSAIGAILNHRNLLLQEVRYLVLIRLSPQVRTCLAPFRNAC